MNNNFMDFIEHDILYKKMLEHYCNDINLNNIVAKSGLIKEPRTEMDNMLINDVSLLTMPINQKRTNKKPAIVITTGSFSPLHEGHVEGMMCAKEYVEGLGYEVIQGVVSLSHDGYVAFKNKGVAKNHISNRTMLAYQKIEQMNQQGWLKVDRFEGEVLSCAVNFSTVIDRATRMIENYLKEELTVFYVFGSDNIGFAYSFISQDKFHALCVDRGGYENKQLPELFSEKNIHYVKNNRSQYKHYSSTVVRKSTKCDYEVKSVSNVKKAIYLIRGNSVPAIFNNQLKNLFEKYLSNGIEVRIYETTSEYHKDCISLDKFVRGDINIDTSRRFEVSSYQKKAIDMVINHMDNLIPGCYKMLDDDSVSGYTIEKITKLLKEKNIFITEVETIVDKYIDKNTEYLYDVVDARDFYLKGFKSGLMALLPNKETKRVPYIFPYVNLSTRANIRADKQIEFSKEIVLLNKNFNASGFESENGEFLLKTYENFLSTEIE